ncbi:anaerobic sulfite reductase subunit AsrB, partial [Patescibacteria group bacterium]|nr:anaerobic sulfite reductase subunit AsrB [Patescibacteria group bacterium]
MENLYKPFKVKIIKIEKHSNNVKLFRLEKNLSFNPGQFILVSYFGYGEAPFGIASSPYQDLYIDIVVRRVGTLTKAL